VTKQTVSWTRGSHWPNWPISSFCFLDAAAVVSLVFPAAHSNASARAGGVLMVAIRSMEYSGWTWRLSDAEKTPPLAVIPWVGPRPLLSPTPFAPNVREVRTLAWTSEYERIIAQFYLSFDTGSSDMVCCFLYIPAASCWAVICISQERLIVHMQKSMLVFSGHSWFLTGKEQEGELKVWN